MNSLFNSCCTQMHPICHTEALFLCVKFVINTILLGSLDVFCSKIDLASFFKEIHTDHLLRYNSNNIYSYYS